MQAQTDSVNAWWASDGDDVATALSSTVQALMEEQGDRRELAQRQLAAYVGCPVEELSPKMLHGIYGDPSPGNQVRRIVDTTVAKVFGKQRPKAQVTTAGADYRTRLTARQQSKFLLANLYQRQGGFADSWELFEQIGKDSLMWQAGVVKVWSDVDNGAIAHERCFCFDLYCDDLDAEYGNPKNLFHAYRYDKHILAAMFPDAREVIMSGESYRGFTGDPVASTRTDQCLVYEGWRLPISKKKPGRHVIAVADKNGKSAVLVDEPWTRRTFPFAFYRYKRAPQGFWGISLVDEVRFTQEHFDEIYEDMSKNIRAVSGGYIVAIKGSILNQAELEKTDRLKVIEIEDKPGAQPPKVEMPPPFNPAVFQFLQFIKSMTFENSGISELAAHGRKEAGIDSGIGQRTMNDMQQELFLPQSRNYERLVVDVARLDLDAANALVDSKVDIALALPNEGFLDEIDWKTIRFPADQYKVTIQAASSLEDTIAGRRQRVIEMAQSGRLNPDKADYLLDSGAIDLESASGSQRAQVSYLERVIAAYQAYDEDKDSEKSIRVYPDPLLDMDLAIIQLTEGYHQMLEMSAPEANCRLVRELIEQFDQEIKKRAPAPQMMPGALGGQAMPPPTAMPMPPPPMQGPPQGMPAQMN